MLLNLIDVGRPQSLFGLLDKQLAYQVFGYIWHRMAVNFITIITKTLIRQVEVTGSNPLECFFLTLTLEGCRVTGTEELPDHDAETPEVILKVRMRGRLRAESFRRNILLSTY